MYNARRTYCVLHASTRLCVHDRITVIAIPFVFLTYVFATGDYKLTPLYEERTGTAYTYL